MSEPEHPEADFVASLGVRSVLDAGCGTGRVAIELARRGVEAVGLDRDARMLRAARRAAPHLTWHHADLTRANLHRRFDAILLAGNVVIFLDPGTEAAALKNLARHLVPRGLLIAAFQLAPGYLSLEDYDRLAEAAGLALVSRFSSWDEQPWTPAGNYAVSVHRRAP